MNTHGCTLLVHERRIRSRITRVAAKLPNPVQPDPTGWPHAPNLCPFCQNLPGLTGATAGLRDILLLVTSYRPVLVRAAAVHKEVFRWPLSPHQPLEIGA
jgi:hypothetical protein